MTQSSERRPEKPTTPFEPLPEWVGPATRLVHADRRAERNAGAVAFPIYQTSTFHFPAEYSEARDGGSVHMYTRHSNPTLDNASAIVAALEGTDGARVFGSGMGALSSVFFTFLRPGDEVVALEDLYGGTLDLLRELLPRYGVTVRWVPWAEATDPGSVVTPRTRLVMVESPTNPLLHVLDLAEWAGAADRVGALLVVDNTFATPINQRPAALGADLVVHSATKYLGGHGDLLAGVVAGPAELLERIDRTHRMLGSVLDPFAGFLLTRGLRTLELRVARQSASGRSVAEALRGHPRVSRVYYPGDGSPQEEEIASRQMAGRGGMVSIVVDGGVDAAHRFLRHLRLVHVATSLGGVESLACIPGETSHRSLSPEELEKRGLDPALVRLSLGVEDPEDLLRDITEALDAA